VRRLPSKVAHEIGGQPLQVTLLAVRAGPVNRASATLLTGCLNFLSVVGSAASPRSSTDWLSGQSTSSPERRLSINCRNCFDRNSNRVKPILAACSCRHWAYVIFENDEPGTSFLAAVSCRAWKIEFNFRWDARCRLLQV
jgi:hypothetical protein